MDVSVRHDARPGDLGAIVRLHGLCYARERGWDATFEAYVAAPLAELVRAPGPRDRLWIAERKDALAGCVAVVGAEDDRAQLRWFLVAPESRGLGLGTRLLREAIEFARASGYRSMFLWTVDGLEDAARLYLSAGFTLAERRPPARLWGADLAEERYELALIPPAAR